MRTKFYSVLILFFITALGFSQNMKTGFTYLETGQYVKAESFFKNTLKDYPNNKTARLCYGRAIGLNGNPEQANALFNNLLKDYPNDFEIKLNYGESLLWTGEFLKAKTYFKGLIEKKSKSFPALLGYANTLSNLKEYKNALIFVNKALDVLPGNTNALTSKKYIYLGFAYKKQQAQFYNEAETLLKENLSFFKNDKDTLLNLANLYLIMGELDKATNTYNILAKNSENRIIAFKGLALTKHLAGKEKLALKLSKQGFSGLNNDTNPLIVQQTTERYIQALIWNKKFKSANTLINNLIEINPNTNWVLTLRATLNIYKSNFNKSLADYNRILTNDSASFDGNLGKANVLKAIGRYNEAYKSAKTTLSFYNKQKDAKEFIKTLNYQFSPFIETKASYTFDNGNNKAHSFKANIEFPKSTKFKWLAGYGYRNTKNTVTSNKASSNNFFLGLAYKLLPNTVFKGTAGLTSVKTDNRDFAQLLADVSFQVKPFKLQVLDLGYKREIQNFNAQLLSRDIVMNNFYVNYSLNTNFNLGWFTQYYYTSQSDDNTRNLLFTSLYYTILAKPSLKAGLNYQYIAFKNQIPTIYFSPERFNAGEVFINLIKDESITNTKAWFYEITAATGYQFIEDNKKQSTYRLQGKLGYKCSNRSLLNIYGTRSNIASATAAGFTFTEIGIRFKWFFGGKNIFEK